VTVIAGLDGRSLGGFLASLGTLVVADAVSPETRLCFDEYARTVVSPEPDRGRFDDELRRRVRSWADNDGSLTGQTCAPRAKQWGEAQERDWDLEERGRSRPDSMTRLVDPTKEKKKEEEKKGKKTGKAWMVFSSADLVLFGRSDTVMGIAAYLHGIFNLPEYDSLLDRIGQRMAFRSLWQYSSSQAAASRNGTGEAMYSVAPVQEALALIGASLYPPVLGRKGKSPEVRWRPWTVGVGVAGAKLLISDSEYLSDGAGIPSLGTMSQTVALVNKDHCFSAHGDERPTPKNVKRNRRTTR